MQGAGLGLFLAQQPRQPWGAWLRGLLGAEPDALLASFPLATAITPALITRQPGTVLLAAAMLQPRHYVNLFRVPFNGVVHATASAGTAM